MCPFFQFDETATNKALKEIHLSFPSGHATFSVQAAVFAVLYIQSRASHFPQLKNTFVLPFVQLVFVAMAFFTCISRVMDHKHHPSDVLGGAFIGTVIQCFNVRFVTRLWLPVAMSAMSMTVPKTPKTTENGETAIALQDQPLSSANNLL